MAGMFSASLLVVVGLVVVCGVSLLFGVSLGDLGLGFSSLSLLDRGILRLDLLDRLLGVGPHRRLRLDRGLRRRCCGDRRGLLRRCRATGTVCLVGHRL